MKLKQIIGLVAFLAGVILLILAIHAKYHISETKITTSHSSGNPLVKKFSIEMAQDAHHYEVAVRWCLIGGVLLIVVGGALFFLKRKR